MEAGTTTAASGANAANAGNDGKNAASSSADAKSNNNGNNGNNGNNNNNNGGSTGTVAPITQPQALINLEVKVLTQSLGAENQWVERGDGRVEFFDFTIRVIAPATPRAEKQGTFAANVANANLSDTVDDEEFEENIILEDIINSETPFVGENCCIVWNSFDQQLSMCLMYASEEGYSASWSALVALQDKAYPLFRFDLLERCTPQGAAAAAAAANASNGVQAPPPQQQQAAAAAATAAVVVPYSCYLHLQYDPPLGFIEQHALSLSIMEFDHLNNPALFEDPDTCMALLAVANGDLVEALMPQEQFSRLLAGLRKRLPPGTVVPPEPKEWGVPDGLGKLEIPADLAMLITKDERLTYLYEAILSNTPAPPEVTLKIKVISHRLRNEITCALLANETLLAQAKDALCLAPPPVVSHRNPADASTSSLQSEAATAAGAAGTGKKSELPTAKQAEQQVLAHLHFFCSLVTLSIAELGRDLVGPIVAKVFQIGLLEALSLVAERFVVSPSVTAAFAAALESNTQKRRSNSTPTAGQIFYYSAAIEAELSLLLDITLVRLNERQGEQLMTETVRAPILAEPLAYNGFMAFLVRQATTPVSAGPAAAVPAGVANGRATPSPSSQGVRRPCRESALVGNPYLLFHVLGLHDDEGASAAERILDPESAAVCVRFHNFVITKYLTLASRGHLAPLPQPPAGNAKEPKNMPIVQFQSNCINSSSADHLPSSPSGGNIGRGAGGSSNNNFFQGISPYLIRTLTLFLRLASLENRELLLRTIFNHKSQLIPYTEACFDAACTRERIVGTDVLGTLARFVREMLMQAATPSAEVDESPIGMMTVVAGGGGGETISRATITYVCRQLTVEREVLSKMMQAYHKLGGRRRDSTFHSAVLATLEMLMRATAAKEECPAGQSSLRDVRNYLFFRHLDILPDLFVRRLRDAMLRETVARLGVDGGMMVSQSALSSTLSSEAMRSTTKLRFVDEVEAASGGVDGTVVPASVANLSPTVVANVHNVEEKTNNTYMNARLSRSLNAESWASTVGGPGRADTPSPKRGDSLHRATSRGSSAGPAAGERLSNNASPMGVMKPTAPKNERPPSRPRLEMHQIVGATPLPTLQASASPERTAATHTASSGSSNSSLGHNATPNPGSSTSSTATHTTGGATAAPTSTANASSANSSTTTATTTTTSAPASTSAPGSDSTGGTVKARSASDSTSGALPKIKKRQ